jgi:hypothetical protein
MDKIVNIIFIKINFITSKLNKTLSIGQSVQLEVDIEQFPHVLSHPVQNYPFSKYLSGHSSTQIFYVVK